MFKLWNRRAPAHRWIRACITTIGFPRELAGLRTMLTKNAEASGRPQTDLETLLHFSAGTEAAWTAPRYMQTGDILLFYHAVSARNRIATMQRHLGPNDRDLADVLKRNAVFAKEYGGTIFACAEITGPAIYERPAGKASHFRGRSFAPFRKVVRFTPPLEEFAAAVTIKRGVALTPVEGQHFDTLKDLLKQQQRLPPFFEAARPGGTDFGGTTAETWRHIACAEDKRFSDEAQVRAYLIDYLLDEIKDPATPRYEECPCFRGGERIGIADYFVQLGGQWMPVEAKLNIYAERDLPAQLRRYTGLDAFQSTGRKRHPGPQHPYCLIIDQAGIYIAAEGVFVTAPGRRTDTLPARPLIARDELPDLPGSAIRARLLSCLA